MYYFGKLGNDPHENMSEKLALKYAEKNGYVNVFFVDREFKVESFHRRFGNWWHDTFSLTRWNTILNMKY